MFSVNLLVLLDVFCKFASLLDVFCKFASLLDVFCKFASLLDVFCKFASLLDVFCKFASLIDVSCKFVCWSVKFRMAFLLSLFAVFFNEIKDTNTRITVFL